MAVDNTVAGPVEVGSSHFDLVVGLHSNWVVGRMLLLVVVVVLGTLGNTLVDIDTAVAVVVVVVEVYSTKRRRHWFGCSRTIPAQLVEMVENGVISSICHVKISDAGLRLRRFLVCLLSFPLVSSFFLARVWRFYLGAEKGSKTNLSLTKHGSAL